MNEILDRVKEMKSTLPGLLALLGSIVVIFKEMVAEVIEWIAGLGYTLSPDGEKLVAVLVAAIGLYLIFGAGKTKTETRVILKDKE